MLLNELIQLFSSNFNINEERFIDIIESKNIKLNQRLLVITNSTKQLNILGGGLINNVTNPNIISTSNISSDNISEPNLNKKESTSRGRGRPRKTKELVEESSVIIEVEIVKIGEKEFYKTSENVLMNLEMEIEGIYVDGKIVKIVAEK